jgi:hypothetical protein
LEGVEESRGRPRIDLVVGEQLADLSGCSLDSSGMRQEWEFEEISGLGGPHGARTGGVVKMAVRLAAEGR